MTSTRISTAPDDNGALKIFLSLSESLLADVPLWKKPRAALVDVQPPPDTRERKCECRNFSSRFPGADQAGCSSYSYLLCLVKWCGVVSISKFVQRRFLKMRNIGRHSSGSTAESSLFRNRTRRSFAAHGKTIGCPQLASGKRCTRLTF